MFLKRLSLTNFRNYARLDVDVPTGSVLLVGNNAQGKTSLLEAIYFLATFISFQADSDRQLINFIAGREPLAVARIVADFQRQELDHTSRDHRLEVRIIQEANGFNGGSRVRKEVLLDGVERKVSEAVGVFNAVLFQPQSLRILEGAPEDRRRYLNLTLAQAVPRYTAALADYNRALTQRNALLKLLNERGGDPSQLTYWDESLASSGSTLIYARIQSIKGLERLATRIHSQLTHGAEILRLSYVPAYDPLPKPERQYSLPLDSPLDRSGIPLEKIQQGFFESLERLHSEEITRGVTTIGPHRDELRYLANGIDLGVFGSRGQSRTAILALKLAEVAWLKEETGQLPVLLLDEVLAELDAQRRSDLLERLAVIEQAMLTTADLEAFSKDFIRHATLWRIYAGQLEELKHVPE